MTDRMQLAIRQLEDATYPVEPKRRMGPIQRQLALMVQDHVAAGRQMVAQRKAKPKPAPQTWASIKRESFCKAAWDDIGNGSACAFARFIVVFTVALFAVAAVVELVG